MGLCFVTFKQECEWNISFGTNENTIVKIMLNKANSLNIAGHVNIATQV